MSTERIDYLIEDSSAGMRKDYAQSLFPFTAIPQIYKMFYLMIYCLAATHNNQGAALYIIRFARNGISSSRREYTLARDDIQRRRAAFGDIPPVADDIPSLRLG